MKTIAGIISYLTIFIVILLFMSNTVSSQVLDSLISQEVSFEELLNMEVVSASRTAQKSSEAPGSVFVITEEDIHRRGYRTLTDVFEDVPGFDFTSKQPTGEVPTDFIFRGITDVGQTNLLIMVDGIIYNDVANGWVRGMGFDFPLIDVKRIELIAGPGSALYGANAYAGLINVITKKSDKNFVNARLLYGSYNTIAPEILYNQNFSNGVSVQLAGQVYYTNGDRGLNRYDPSNYFHNNYEPDSVYTTEYGNIANDKNPDGTRKKIADGFNNSINDLSIRGKIMKDGFSLGFSYWNRYEGLGSQGVGYEYFANTDKLDYIAHHSGKTLFLSYEFALNESIQSFTRLYYNNTTVLPETGFYYTFAYQSVNNGINPAVPDKRKSYFEEGFLTRLEQQFNYKMSSINSIVFGFHLESQNKQFFGVSIGPKQDENSTIVNSTYPTGLKSVQPMFFSKNLGAYVQDEFKLLNNYSLTAGLRYDYDVEFGSTFIPRLAFVGKLWEDFSFKLLYGQAYKAPSFFELYEEWRGNQDLKPKKINTYEMELNYNLFDMVNFRTNVYYSNLFDLIVIAPNPDPQKVPIGPNGEHAEYYQNIGEKEIYGISFISDIYINKDIFITANYSFTAGSNFSYIDNIAMHKINLAINYKFMDYLNINLRANYLGNVKAPISNYYFYPKDANTISKVGYDYVTKDNPNGFLDKTIILNLTITGKNISIFGLDIEPQLIIRNLLDTQYYLVGTLEGSGIRPVDNIQPTIQNPAGFLPAYHPQPGREIFFKLGINF